MALNLGKITHLGAVLVICLFFSGKLWAVEFNIDEDRIAMHGYDPVSYFQGDPKEGSKEFEHALGGVSYLFASKNNLDLFKATPQKYQPAFGGYCAYGVRVGKKFNTSPDAYAIESDKLYLMLDRSTKKVWDADKDRNIQIAEGIWPSIKAVPAEQLKN